MLTFGPSRISCSRGACTGGWPTGAGNLCGHFYYDQRMVVLAVSTQLSSMRACCRRGVRHGVGGDRTVHPCSWPMHGSVSCRDARCTGTGCTEVLGSEASILLLIMLWLHRLQTMIDPSSVT